MLKLYYAPGACSLAVHIVLEWIGKPYEAVRVNQHDPEYKKINPAAAVPALEYGGEHPLTQCAAILQYLARLNPDADLLDDQSAESAAQLERWSAFLTGDLHPSFFPVFMPGRYTKAEDRNAIAAVKEAGLALVRTKIELLDRHLEGRRWMIGDKRTILDAYVTPMLNWAQSMLPEELVNFTNVSRHHVRMLADSAVQRVMAIEKGDAR